MANKTTEEMRNYIRIYRANKRAECKAALGDKCVKCGATTRLEFDHIDRSTKIEGIANLLTNSKDILKAELDKCQLLCNKCHLEKSFDAGDLIKAKHGIGQFYKKGCRCDVCVKATRNYRRAYYEMTGK